MTYDQAVKKINSLLRFGIKPGLERVSKLLEYLGNPQKELRFVHVAGTNGKGTTCTLMASALRQAGYRTGLFTSPYVIAFRERFQINGEMIPEQTLAALLDEILPVVEQMAENEEVITEFELITALALLWFARSRCDVVVLEVGLGGRFDATNVIPTPLVSVIASISLDHTAILGDTLEQIAFEKAGILKQGGVTVLYPDQQPEVLQVIRRVAQERNNRLVLPDFSQLEELGTDIHGTRLRYKGMALKLPFIGAHQMKNAATAWEAIQVLRERGLTISDPAVQQGFAAAAMPARMEVLSERPLVLLDGGHNPGCAGALRQVMETYLSERKIVAIVGMMADKDSRTALSLVAPSFAEVLTVRPENPRALSAEELAEEARTFCARVKPMGDMEAAFRLALGQAGEEGAVVICGSFFLAGEIRPIALKVLRQRQK